MQRQFRSLFIVRADQTSKSWEAAKAYPQVAYLSACKDFTPMIHPCSRLLGWSSWRCFALASKLCQTRKMFILFSTSYDKIVHPGTISVLSQLSWIFLHSAWPTCQHNIFKASQHYLLVLLADWNHCRSVNCTSYIFTPHCPVMAKEYYLNLMTSNQDIYSTASNNQNPWNKLTIAWSLGMTLWMIHTRCNNITRCIEIFTWGVFNNSQGIAIWGTSACQGLESLISWRVLVKPTERKSDIYCFVRSMLSSTPHTWSCIAQKFVSRYIMRLLACSFL